MIEELRIRDLGVIHEARLTLPPGLTVVSGETGAGKTMLLTGLDLVRGGKVDPARVRPGADRAVVEALVAVPGGDAIEGLLAQADAEVEEGAVILGRSVPVEGRSRATLGGRSVPSSVLAELAGLLVAVHGQGDQQRLGRSDVQRDLLDRVGGEPVAVAAGSYRALHDRLRGCEAEVRDIRASGADRAAEALRLGALLGDLESLAPEPGEGQALATESERLAHAEGLRAAAEQAHAALSGEGDDPDVLGLLAGGRRALDHERAHDPLLGGLSDRLAAAAAELADTAADLASYAASVDADPARLAWVHARRADLATFERRHGQTVDAVLEQAAALSERLAGLEHGDERAQELEREASDLREKLVPAVLALHAAREAVAGGLAERVGVELAALAMPHARVQWRVALAESVDEDALAMPDGRRVALRAHGADEVELLLASHAEAPLLPLGRAASGGELARVMLAIEVVLAGLDPVPTMVFDEVDAGVGGRAAVEVGRRLAALARTTQVLVVTHLAQVAAFADQHVVVVKSTDGDVTQSDVRVVSGEERVRELARMLAGLDDSASAAEHARELLELAEQDRRA